jgi:thiamine-phosphate pyrophosphorylase
MSESSFARVRLMAITDIARFGVPHTHERAEKLCERAVPGSVLVQLRDRGLSGRERLSIARELARLVRRTGQGLVVNDRLDLARMVGADGVHLGEGSVTPSDARRLLGESAFVSRACHDPAALDESWLASVDAVLLSPIFAQRKGQPALGEAALGEAGRRLSQLPVRVRLFALGGVDAGAARRLAETEIGVAAIGAVFEDDPGELLAALDLTR